MVDEVGKRLLARRRVMLVGPIDPGSATLLCSQLLVLDAEAPTEPVVIYINSPGGSVDDGFAIYDTMRTMRAEVVTVCLGLAASMAQFVLCAGAPGRRYAHRYSRVLMHQPHGQVEGTATDIHIQAAQFAYLRSTMAELTAQHTGQTVERIVADADRDLWLTAEEARAYGMIDHVLDGPLPL
ncbi:MAG TPA: ATP-dependent Clp protease proteolytic subunit [Acidimicrobiia bacterium]